MEQKITHFDAFEEFRDGELIHLPLVPPGSKLLHTKTMPFDFKNPQLNPGKLRDQLIVTMFRYGGLGLSANQVGIPLSVFVLRPDTVCFNPKIIKYSDEKVSGNEGCLSYPLLYLPIKRSRAIIISFYDENGVEKQDVYEGLSARCFQHELDHLEGINYQNRCDIYHRNKALRGWKKFIKDKKRAEGIISARGEDIVVSPKRNFDKDKNEFTYSS